MTKRSKSSSRWLDRQKRDPYVKKAASGGLGSRAHFKLKELDARFSLLRPQLRVLELGAAPGGWTRYLAERVHAGRIIAVDYRVMQVPSRVTFVQLDIHADEYVEVIDGALAGAGVDLVLSDMSPNISGVRAADQAATMELVELATETAARWLNPGGALVVKMFQGEGVDAWVKDTRARFAKVSLAKPTASRAESREVYGIATGFTAGAVANSLRGGRSS